VKLIKDFIHRYLELPANFEDISSLYVLLTWVYEFSPTMPYLRVIGDWGSGKTRFLQVVGDICFRPIFASGATTPAPVFRILEQYRGTLVLDEADFKDSAAWTEIVKLLNNGYRPGMPVLRADKEDGKWYPRSYQVFGPKLISTRFPFHDEALESRCLTAEMLPLSRDDIPRVLPPTFDTEVNDLRAKLLTFRLANLFRLKGKTFGNELLEPNLQPRLQEILIPLKAMLNGDHSMVEALAGFVHRLQETLFSRRRESQSGRVIAAMIELHKQEEELTSKSIAEKAADKPLVLALNKSDLLKPEDVVAHSAAYRALVPEATPWMLVSATRGDNLDELLAFVIQALPEGPALYPEDEVTQTNLRDLAGPSTSSSPLAAPPSTLAWSGSSCSNTA
jgi:hypothetical protein